MNRLSERSLLLLLAGVQFTHIMDFMILMPLGPQLMRELHIGPGHFSALVAAYTISSGLVGLLAAPFIDRFDRRKVLLLAYAGFTGGTLACALSQNAATLLAARALSGAFGGLSTAMVMAIIGDVVPAERRAAGVGIVMTAFSVAAAAGIPFGLKLAQHWRWEAPFFLLAAIAVVVWTIAFLRLPAIQGHLQGGPGQAARAFAELLRDTNAGRALLFMVAIERKSRSVSACVGKRPAVRAASSVPYFRSRAAAPAGPTPRAPGSLSDGSPRNAMKSGTWFGSTP